MRIIPVLAVFCGLLLPAADCSAQSGAGRSGGSQAVEDQSRRIWHAMKMYRNGDYQKAMDLFMDVLVNGSPSERAIANEYVNKISQKLEVDNWETDNVYTEDEEEQETADGQAAEPSLKKELSKMGGVVISGVKSVYYRLKTGKPAPEQPPARVEAAAATAASGPAGERARQVDQKISAMRGFISGILSKTKGVRVFMDGDRVEALMLDPAVLFSKSLKFRQPAAGKILSAVAGLMYTNGNVCFVITPQGFTSAGARMLDMRRAMAVNSYLMHKGISAARLFVNLGLSSQEPLPHNFKDIQGIGITFDYARQPLLSQSDGSGRLPPRTTLGVFPSSISTDRMQGAIVEFAAIETSARVDYWRLQIFRAESDGSLSVMQETSGQDAAYHQIFWNARKGFSGAASPPGKYLCVFTASDSAGREQIARRVINVTGMAQAGKGRLLKKGAAGGGQGIGVVIRKGKAAAKRKAAAHKKTKKRAPRSGREVSDENGFVAMSGRKAYTIRYGAGTADISDAAKPQVAKLADMMVSRPDDKVIISARASSSEPDAAFLAEKRAKALVEMLVNEYGVDTSMMDTKTEVSAQAEPVCVVVFGE
ncbi:MAG: hypothetical protein WC421_08510 [Elusimicrobiales bacterium]